MRNQGGFALIAALWLLVILSTVMLELSLQSRARRVVAANTLEATQAQAAAEAGIHHARARLERILPGSDVATGTSLGALAEADPWERPGALFPYTEQLGETRYQVELRDLGGALNLNRADEEELRRFFSALRVDFGEADRIAQSVMDWRDPDEEHRGRGAERDAYLRLGRPMLPRNGPFQELAELRYVQGVTPDIYERARPYLTLLGTGRVNLNAADRPVLLALPGMTDRAVAVLMRLRAQGRRVESLQELAEELSLPAREALEADMTNLLRRTTFETREVEVRSRGWVEAGRVRIEAQGLLVRVRSTAFLVWKRVS